MKRNLFTLLLVIVTLTAFQANAQQARWILADTSGLAKNASHSDSFPNNKWGLHNWLTVDGSSIKVHPRADAASSSEIYKDSGSKFSLEVFPDSSFRIRKNESDSFKIGSDARFEIVQFLDNQRTVQAFGKDTIEGYLTPVQRGTLGSDNANLILACADKNGTLSFKKFSDFAAHADTLPASPCLSYQFNDTTVKGRLYQSDSYPYFQTYHTDVKPDSALVKNGGIPINWSERRKDKSINPQNPYIYSYYDFKYDDKGGISTNDTTVRLDTIVNYVKSHDSLSGIDTATVGNKNDSLLYFKTIGDDDYRIAFTALAKDSSWTNGEPTMLEYKDQPVWYYIDATDTTKAFFALKQVLIDLFHFNEEEHFDPAHNQVERYIYKHGDDWRPLYVKVVPSCDLLPYEYVTSQWLSENYYDIAAVSQKIFDALGTPTNSSVSTDATVTSSDQENSEPAKFLFEHATTIRSDSTINGVMGVKFSNYKEIDLFHIKHDSKYLTVLDTTIFAGSIADSTVTNTQLGWKEKLTGLDSLRQVFAIVYNSEDSIITLLPVASYKWKLDGTAAKYGTTLYYNENIGKKSPNTLGDLFIDLSEAWYIKQLSKTGDRIQRLVIAEPNTISNILWFKMTTEYTLAKIDMCDEDSALAIYDKTGKYYYPVKGERVEGPVTDGMIRQHWTVRDTTINKIKRWIFTPELDSIYGKKVDRTNLTDTFIALNVGGDTIELISGTRSPYRRDTITVQCVGHSTPFLNLDPYVGVSKRVAILESRYGDRNISYLSPNENKPKSWGANDSVQEAFFSQVDLGNPVTYTMLTVYNSNVQYLGKNNRHKVPYYVFSYKDDEGEEYFLSAQQGISGDSVRWVKLDDDERTKLLAYWETENKGMYSSFKFCLPYTDGEDHNNDDSQFTQPVYLQTLDSSQIDNSQIDNSQIGNYSLIDLRNDSSLSSVRFSDALLKDNDYIPEEGIYSAIDQYKNEKINRISSWKFYREDVIGSGWVRIGAVIDVDAGDLGKGKNGVFTNVDNSSPGTLFIVPRSETSDSTVRNEVNYGVLSDIKQQGVELTLKWKGGAQIGYEKDSIWYYKIKHNDLYLTDAVDSVDNEDNEYAYKYFSTVLPYAFFTTDSLDEHTSDGVYADSAFRQTFALQYVKEPAKDRENFVFLVVSSADYTKQTPEYRYLSRLDARLIFVDEEFKDSALRFQWGKVDDNGYTDIKVIGVPATIYGVAGGVKTVNATGAVAIYTIDGRLVTVKAVVSPDQTIAVPAGIYIVKNGVNVTKVVVK